MHHSAPILGPSNYALSDRKRYSVIWSTLDSLPLALLNERSSRKIWLALSKVDLLWKISSWLGNSCSFQVIPMTSKLGFLFRENYFTYLNFQAAGQTIASSAPACLWNSSQRVVRAGEGMSAQCVQQGKVHKASTIFPRRIESCKTVILTMLLSPEVEFKDCSESNLKQLSENGFPGWLVCQGS